MAKTRNILFVSNEYEAVRYKIRYSALLEGAALVFPDELTSFNKRVPVRALYYTDTVNPDQSVFERFRPLVPPIPLSI